MNFKNLIYASACLLPLVAMAQEKSLGVVTVSWGQPTSLPTQIPTTMEGITKEQIEKSINATDSEDALRYFPSLLVRKRYIGDYNHAVLSSRASGTGNSARSAVYADGILLSNYLGNGATYAPRWGMVTPEEIERVDVMYGPFSAAYSSNTSTRFDTLNKFQPRVPMWRASGLALYRWNEQLSTSLGARYSGKQYSQLGNYDVNGFTYTGVSKYFTVDTRLHYQFDKQWSGAVGIDNLNNYKYWNFHLYPGRTLLAELKWTH